MSILSLPCVTIPGMYIYYSSLEYETQHALFPHQGGGPTEKISLKWHLNKYFNQKRHLNKMFKTLRGSLDGVFELALCDCVVFLWVLYTVHEIYKYFF